MDNSGFIICSVQLIDAFNQVLDCFRSFVQCYQDNWGRYAAV
jgi:hypothetical protein